MFSGTLRRILQRNLPYSSSDNNLKRGVCRYCWTPALSAEQKNLVCVTSDTMGTVELSGTMKKFVAALESIYGSFETLTQDQCDNWEPADLSEGHKGRYLWTDGFGVLNFLTLFKEVGDSKYLICAKSLVNKVHSVLGYNRQGTSRLPCATDEFPLKGGLRIGKHDADGEDGDGQYFHYLTVWMFALHQMTVASGNVWYAKQAAIMAKAVHGKFIHGPQSSRPRMYWKMAMDLSEPPLVMSEGNLDPFDGLETYSLLNDVGKKGGFDVNLDSEINVFKKIVDSKYQAYSSSDPLDLGMTLWTTQWKFESDEWAKVMTRSAFSCLWRLVNDRSYFDRPMHNRLAFREFGTVLGLKCHPQTHESRELEEKIIHQWEKWGAVPIPLNEDKVSSQLQPITSVMYATALNPAAFRKDFSVEKRKC